METRRNYKNQKIVIHNSRATGNANSMPLAKLRWPPKRAIPCLKSPSGSFMDALSSIGIGRLVLSASHQCNLEARRSPSRGRRDTVRSSGHSRLACLQPFVRATGDLGFFLRLFSLARALHEEPRDCPPVQQAIRIRPAPGQRRVRYSATQTTILQTTIMMSCLALPRPASAQDANVVTPVELFDPEQGQGIRLGPDMVAMPELDADVTYNSNVYNVKSNETKDAVFSLRPALTLRTDLPRHEFSLRGAADIRRYVDTSSENSEQYEVVGSGRLDLASRTELDLDTGYRRGIEQRGTAGDYFLTDQPVRYDQTFAGIRLLRTGGLIESLAELRVSDFNYKDATLNGVPLDLSGRDVTIGRARLRGSAPTGRNTRVFVEVSGNQVRYDHTAATPRDSSGFAVLAGMQVNVTNLVSLEAGVGYLQQNFDDPAVQTVKGVNYHLQAKWTPKPDWRITASADRQFDRSPRSDVPAILSSSFRLQASKVVGDRLLLTAEGGFVSEKYEATTGEAQRYFIDARAHYRLTDRIGLIAEAGYRSQDGTNGPRDYDGYSVSVGVRFAL